MERPTSTEMVTLLVSREEANEILQRLLKSRDADTPTFRRALHAVATAVVPSTPGEVGPPVNRA